MRLRTEVKISEQQQKYYFLSQPYLPYKKKETKKVEFDHHLRHPVDVKPLNIHKDQIYS